MFTTKLFILLSVAVAVTFAVPQMTGGVSPVEDLTEVEQELKNSLSKLDAGDGPHYKLSKVYKASRQVVEGVLTKIEADIIDEEEKTQKCNITIWSRPWLDNGIEVTFECEGKPTLTKHHSA
ncbi:sarcocystatin-A-like [Musca domestica]|uniref:Sarcocystatin-A-like n=1 Tax=Musca domestica TaxID=7370 RepID=A0ABM3VQS9_MUSDO|nr:sarcocystatin-A-like [Musca domestica]